MLALKTIIGAGTRLSQAELARKVGVSPATIAQLVNKDIWPTQPPRLELQAAITTALIACGLPDHAELFETAPTAPTAGADKPLTEEVLTMLLRKQTLSPATKKHFNLSRDPFDDDINEPDDVYIGKEQSYIYETLRSCWLNQGFTAIVGESGSGKTTLKDRMLDDLRNQPVAVITPGVTEMGLDNGGRSRPLTMSDINDAIVAALTPTKSVRRSSQARQRQVKEALMASGRSGYKNLLIIEEAHDMATQTLRQLKRLREEKDGSRLLLGVLLIGQPELAHKLNIRSNWEAREVVQRCELVELTTLDAQLDDYLRFKFKRVGSDLDTVFDKDALDGIRARLVFTKPNKNNRETLSLMYPLMVNNLVTGALNQAAQLGFAKVSGDLIREA